MRQFRRYPSWSVWACGIVCAAIAVRYWWGGDESTLRHAAEGSSFSGQFVAGEFEIVRIERTDLLIIRQQVSVLGKEALKPLEAPLQLIGVKSPMPSEEGKRFTSDFLSSGTPALDLDRRRLDSAGHFLGYVYVDGRLLNEEVIRAGLAQSDLYPGDNQTMHKNFVKAEKEAKKAGRGMWASAENQSP